ncbi:MAG: M20/M25/M40 family metallo-hydrolase [Planctomycetes bacterium]|nr:M20/M25/M40 family metallo-hydrolase [Planctomycetota bacterium]
MDEESGVWLKSQYPRHAGSGRRRAGQDLELPVALVSPAVAERIAGRPLLELRDEIDEKQSPRSFAVPQVRVRLEVRLAEKGISAANVVARYRGGDPELVGAAVVVGAHLDHIGVDDRGRVYRGADDNAAGVAALLEVAEAYATSKTATRRSIIFVAFTGEEKGLLGANAYVREPPVPITQTYAMINMDIISRGRKNAIEATPPPKASLLDQLLKKAVGLSDCGLKVGDGGKEFFQQSDHFAFHEAGVPTVFLNEGNDSEDLHRWTDTADKVLEEKVARVAKLAFALSYMAANSDLKGGLR